MIKRENCRIKLYVVREYSTRRWALPDGLSLVVVVVVVVVRICIFDEIYGNSPDLILPMSLLR